MAMATMAGGMDTNASAACLVDADCPGQLLCYKDVGWAPGEPPFCDCSTWYGRSGPPDCQQLNVNGWAMMVLTSLNLVAAGVYAVRSCRDARIAVFVLGRATKSALLHTILLVSAALISLTLWMGLVLAELSMGAHSDFIVVLAHGEKRSQVSLWANYSLLALQTSAGLAVFSVSLVWIEVGHRVNAMSITTQRTMRRYYVLCIIASCAFLLALTLAASLAPHMGYTSLIAIPFMFIMAIFFSLGRNAFLRLLLTADRMGASDRIKRARSSIKHCSTRVILGMLAVAISGALFVLTISGPSGWKGAAPRHGITRVTISFQSVPLAMFQLQRTLFLYCHDNVQARLKLRAQRASRQHRGSVKVDQAARVDPGRRSSTMPRKAAKMSSSSLARVASAANPCGSKPLAVVAAVVEP